jgi:hypothetical protein
MPLYRVYWSDQEQEQSYHCQTEAERDAKINSLKEDDVNASWEQMDE